MELGINGHETRGKEVIELLEMLGGNNRYSIIGCDDNSFYHINNHNEIVYSYIGPEEIKGYEIFSLEDFLEKFPYKIGDKVEVLITENYLKVDCSGGHTHIEVAEIISMRWDPARCRIVYKMKDVDEEFCTEDIKGKVIDIAIKTSKNMEEKKIYKMSLANCDHDEVEIVLGDRFELKIREGKYYAIRKKPQYPKDYEECCQYLGCDDKIKMELVGQFTRLINARNSYWKIAGEQMGLGKPWEPDFDNLSTTHEFIKIDKGCFYYSSKLLVFPTIEMRDEFQKNFKDLIETCKELL